MNISPKMEDFFSVSLGITILQALQEDSMSRNLHGIESAQVKLLPRDEANILGRAAVTKNSNRHVIS
ncbi:hypothetical protein, partial [Pseudomonas koreensis]|uniref:hypothetical protein n=1 Tax=Pseudomonas koreensis TaxID=198620 RepID=UPI0032080C7B